MLKGVNSMFKTMIDQKYTFLDEKYTILDKWTVLYTAKANVQ